MSTRSNIGIMNENGTVSVIFCHWDGYPGYVGRVLVDNYKTMDKIDKLINLGDLSTLGEEPISSPERWEREMKFITEDDGYRGCLAYRDRGEENVDAITYADVKSWLKEFKTSVAEYAYLFEDGVWKYYTFGKKKFTPLTEKILADRY